jgi:hypothetical protein
MTKAEVKALDTLVSLKVRARQGGCVWCPEMDGIWHPHHLISRRYRSVRWEPDNLVKICNRCHYKAHQHPLWAERMAIELIGEHRFFELKQMAEMVKGVNDYQLIRLVWR